MQFIKKILTQLLLLFGIKRKKISPEPNKVDTAPTKGTDGEVEVDAIVVVKEERIVLVVDLDFKDIPCWVEWDVTINKLSIAQKGGANAYLRSPIPVQEFERFKSLNRILLISRYHGRRIVHYLTFIASNNAMKSLLMCPGQLVSFLPRSQVLDLCAPVWSWPITWVLFGPLMTKQP